MEDKVLCYKENLIQFKESCVVCNYIEIQATFAIKFNRIINNVE